LSSTEEVDGVSNAQEMLSILIKGHEQGVRTCRAALVVVQGADDESSAALIFDRMRIHEKVAWMLRATAS
jgi:starvation-inducible DNA-binding protein